MISLVAVYFQVDLQAQARAHRIGQKKDVLVLRFETVSTFISVTDSLELRVVRIVNMLVIALDFVELKKKFTVLYQYI